MAIKRAITKRRVEVQDAGGLTLRLLICDRCQAVWPTERAPEHGGSRSDGEPCAYRWSNGRVCTGFVYPVNGYVRSPFAQHADTPAARQAYSGRWCEILGVKWGTVDLALVRARYRELCKSRHPDVGGSHDGMVRLNAAYRQALAELGQP